MFVCLGVDGGFTRLGASVCTVEDGVFDPGLAGIISQSRGENQSFNDFLNSGILNICEQFTQILALTQPDLILAEIVPVGRLGSRSELVVAAVTACKVIAHFQNITWKDISANSWKKELTGNGLATKTEIRNSLLGKFSSLKAHHDLLKREQKDQGVKAIGFEQDLFDALGIAVVGCQRHG